MKERKGWGINVLKLPELASSVESILLLKFELFEANVDYLCP